MSPQMRLTFVTPFYYPEHKFGGPPRKIHSLSRGLAELGHEVCVLTFDSERAGNGDEVTIDGVRVNYLRWIGKGLKQWPREIERIQAAVEWSQLVHCYGIYNFLVPIATCSARRHCRPFVLEPLGMYPARTGNSLAKNFYNGMVTRRIAKSAAALIAASEPEVLDLEGLAPSEKIVHRRNGVDIERFKALPSGELLRSRWGVKSGTRIALFVGRLSPIKNLEQLILAFGLAHVPDTRLVLVGPAEPAYEKRLRALVEREKLGSRVIFAGALYEDDQMAALASASLFVIPSINESFGNAAAEAVAAGVPVLLTETCGIAALIHERAGLAVPLGIEAIAHGLTQMLEHSPFISRMTARREEVKRELSWDEPIRQTEELYAHILVQAKK